MLAILYMLVIQHSNIIPDFKLPFFGGIMQGHITHNSVPTTKKALMLIDTSGHALENDSGVSLFLGAKSLVDSQTVVVAQSLKNQFMAIEQIIQDRNEAQVNRDMFRAQRQAREQELEKLGVHGIAITQDEIYKELAAVVKEQDAQHSKHISNLKSALNVHMDTILNILKQGGTDVLTFSSKDKLGQPAFRPTELTVKIEQLANNVRYDCIVIGGGHGGTTHEGAEVLSGMPEDFVVQTINQLHRKQISSDLITLGTCEGAIFINRMRTLLATPQGVVIGAMGDSKNNFIANAFEFVNGNYQFLNDANPEEKLVDSAPDILLAILKNNKVTVFDPPAVIKNNAHIMQHWNNSFKHIYQEHFKAHVQGVQGNFFNEIEILSHDENPAVDGLVDAQIFGNNSNKKMEFMNHVLFSGSTELIAKNEKKRKELHQDSVIDWDLNPQEAQNMWQVTRSEIAQFAQKQEEHYMELSQHLYQLGNQVDTVIPTLTLKPFEEQTAQRVNYVNSVVQQVQPPMEGISFETDVRAQLEMVLDANTLTNNTANQDVFMPQPTLLQAYPASLENDDGMMQVGGLSQSLCTNQEKLKS